MIFWSRRPLRPALAFAATVVVLLLALAGCREAENGGPQSGTAGKSLGEALRDKEGRGIESFRRPDDIAGETGGNAASQGPGNDRASVHDEFDPDDERPLIAVCYDEAGLPFRAVQGHLVQRIFASREATIRFKPYDAMGSSVRQAQQIRDLIAIKPEVALVYAFVAKDLAEPLAEAKSAGIKIALVGSSEIESLPADLRVVVDERAIGQAAGEFVIERLKRKMQFDGSTQIAGKVVEITGLDLVGDMTRQRSEGFHRALSAHPGIELVHQAPGLWNEGDAAARLLEALRLQDEVDVVYAHNDAMAYACYLAAREAGRHQQMLLLGTDGIGGPVGGISRVRDQLLGGTVIVPLMIEEIATSVMALAQGDAPSANRFAPQPEIVSIANANEKYRVYTKGPEEVMERLEKPAGDL